MENTEGLKLSAERLVGSSPTLGTNKKTALCQAVFFVYLGVYFGKRFAFRSFSK